MHACVPTYVHSLCMYVCMYVYDNTTLFDHEIGQCSVTFGDVSLDDLVNECGYAFKRA